MTDSELQQRRGFWMRMARERAGLTQAVAAKELGLSGESKSTLSAWESGSREPRMSHVAKMATLYRVPVDLLMNPPVSAYEVIDRRLSLAIADAEALEQRDWDEAGDRGRADDDGRDASPGRRSA